MFQRILVGIDEETRGRDAIALARLLMSRRADLTFAHVYPGIGSGSTTNAEASRQLLASVVDESGVDAWTRWIASPSVAAGLRTIAAQTHADLVVIGTTNRSRITRALLGNPTTETMGAVDCVVAVAPEGYADRVHEIRKVGVAYDGSSPSEGALSLARELVEKTHAELSAFEVVPPPDVFTVRRHQMERAVLALSAARAQLAAHEGVEAHVACGHPVSQLGGFSKTVDILVAGSRGAGFAARLLHPSTTAALTDVVSCPLLVLTRGAREQRAAAAARVAGALHDPLRQEPVQRS